LRYILGQLFCEWPVRLDSNAVGGLRADRANTPRGYVKGNGVQVTLRPSS
jgi:hypothetical protein